MFAAASYVVSDHLRVQRNFCAERVRQVVGGKPITHRAIGPIERRRADELLSLRGCTPPGPGLAPKDRGWAGLKDSRQCAGRWCGGGAHGSDRCSKLRGAAQPEQTNTPSIGRPSVSADPGGGRQLTTVQAKETDRKIFFAKKCNA